MERREDLAGAPGGEGRGARRAEDPGRGLEDPGRFQEPPGDGTAIALAGAHGARRIDRAIDLGEGVSEDGIDRVATAVAAGRRAFVLLSIRTRPADEAAAEVERTIRSLTVLDA